MLNRMSTDRGPHVTKTKAVNTKEIYKADVVSADGDQRWPPSIVDPIGLLHASPTTWVHMYHDHGKKINQPRWWSLLTGHPTTSDAM